MFHVGFLCGTHAYLPWLLWGAYDIVGKRFVRYLSLSFVNAIVIALFESSTACPFGEKQRWTVLKTTYILEMTMSFKDSLLSNW